MARARRLVVLGASAGGVEALTRFVSRLPPHLGAPVVVVLHVSPHGSSVLAKILDRAAPLHATAGEDGEALEDGHIYVAPPDHHLAVEDGRLRVTSGPRENGHRPAIDPLFRSAASEYGEDAIAIVLSGTRDDGTLGAGAVKAAGGVVLAQSLDDALYPDMPASVIANVQVDAQAPAAELAEVVRALLGGENGGAPPMPDQPDPVSEPDPGEVRRHAPGEDGASGFVCPECGGAIYLDHLNGVPRFTCHAGHGYSVDSFVGEQERTVEMALWTAVRQLDERAALLKRMQQSIGTSEHTRTQLQYRADEAERHARVIRQQVLRVRPEDPV